MPRTFPPTLVFTVLAAAAAAQVAPQVEHKLAVELPSYAQGNAYLRCEPARIGDDPVPDAVVLFERGGVREVGFLLAPAQFTVLVPVASDVRDAAVLPGHGTAGDDVILVLDDDGLHWFDCEPGQHVPTERVDHFDPSFAGCDCLGVGTNANGDHRLFAASDTSATVRRSLWSGAWQDAGDLIAVSGATQILTLDWDGVGEHEVVLRFGAQVYVLTWEGAAFWTFPFPAAPSGRDLLCVLPGGNGEPDLLAAYGWLPSPAPSGPPSVHALLVQRAGLAWIEPFGVQPMASIACGDTDGDGRPDLLLGDATGSQVFRVRREAMSAGAGQPIAAAGSYALVQGAQRPNGGVDALSALDFDGDGDTDLVGLQSQHQLHHFLAGGVAPSRRLAEVDVVGLPEPVLSAEGWSLQMKLVFTLPDGWETIPIEAGECLALDANCWVQTSAEAPLPAVPQFFTERIDVGAVPEWLELELAGDTIDPDTWQAWIQVRLSVVGPTGARMLPPLLLHYTPDYGLAEVRHYTQLADELGASGHLPGKDGGDGSTVGGGDPNREPGEPPPVQRGEPGPIPTGGGGEGGAGG